MPSAVAATSRRRLATHSQSSAAITTNTTNTTTGRPLRLLRLIRQTHLPRTIHTTIHTTTKMATVGPVIALSHGGGPMPVLGDPGHKSITESLQNRVPKLLKLGTPEQPRAIVLVTAHWSTDKPTISSGAKHSLYYDYYGFPKESYALKYPAPGSPEVAHELRDALMAEGLQPELDDERGWDHGVFIPLLLVNPKADVPVVQMSVLESEDPAQHISMGKALAKLRASNVAIVGSGFASLHNMRIFRMLWSANASQISELRAVSDTWNSALTDAASKKNLDERFRSLQAWRKLPHADLMHPPHGGEHFMPLLVCAGAATEGEETKKYSDDYKGLEINTYYWGAEEVI